MHAAGQLDNIQRVVIVACGTSFHAGLVAKYAIEQWARIPVEVVTAAEFRYCDPIVGPDTLCIAVTQSGETADTLVGIRQAREQGAPVIAVTNVVASAITRLSDAVLYLQAGPEIWRGRDQDLRQFADRTLPVGYSTWRNCVGRPFTRADRTVACWPGGVAREDPADSGPRRWSRRYDRAPGPKHSRMSIAPCLLDAALAIPSPWRVRSSSKRSPTSTPRVCLPANSSTARLPCWTRKRR